MAKKKSKSQRSTRATSAQAEPEPISQEPKIEESDASDKVGAPQLIKAIISSLSDDAPTGSADQRDDLIRRYLRQVIAEHGVSAKYNILIIFDEGRMVKLDADNIYSAATQFEQRKSLLLVLYSSGGDVGSAYLIGKLCREYTDESFVVVVPRGAKSAATLLCCAADEIHMGSLSELGPIDPQIEGLPALGLRSAVENIADLVKNHPHAADMFAKYLHLSLRPIHLGHYERVAESATQYAERLLRIHEENLGRPPHQIAHDLVYAYKDHAFVIDKSEAAEIFGGDVVKTNTPEYNLGNAIYDAARRIGGLAGLMNHYFYLIGSCNSKPRFVKRKRK